MMFALVAHRDTPTNLALVEAGARAGVQVARLTPRDALGSLRSGDTAVGRLDVRESLDGVEAGLWALAELAERGVRVLNPPAVLLTAHDKLLTSRALRRAGIPHPATRLVLPSEHPVDLEAPVVLKPRYGSWGRDVVRCEDGAQLDATLERFQDRPWFRTQGVLAQELVPPRGFDLRIVVAGSRIVGAIERRAAPGEWRTNIALGGSRRQVDPACDACELALRVAAALSTGLVGVDLLPTEDGWVVLELNGAVDFTRQYARGEDVFRTTLSALVGDDLDVGETPAETAVVPA
jgi:RimK family alpha-L-glutamate ligase